MDWSSPVQLWFSIRMMKTVLMLWLVPGLASAAWAASGARQLSASALNMDRRRIFPSLTWMFKIDSGAIARADDGAVSAPVASCVEERPHLPWVLLIHL